MSLFRQSQSSAASSLLQMMYIYSSSTHYLLQASIELIELLLTIITQRGEKKKEKKRRRSNPKTKETMESAGAIMEGGEWSSFNGVYISEEANFMAQLFPTNCSLPTDNVADEDSSLACWSNDFTMTTNSNLYCSFSQESCYTGGSGIVTYPTAGHDNYYACDTDSTHRFLAANKMLIEFHEDNKERPGEVEDADDNDLLLKRESDISGSSVISKKRSRPSDVPKGKRNATRSKKRQKASSVEEDKNGGVLNRQSSSSYNSEEESNLSLELNNGGATSSSVLNSNGKTRASRGSATDPQSLYARKRRERINERLRTLQNLVPNGTKVDISTMLEEAVQYVKFLQLQIKLMSSEDLWMYAPIAYNGMDIGLDFKFNAPK